MKRVGLCALVVIALTAAIPSAQAVVPDDQAAVAVSGTVVSAATADPLAEVCVSTRPPGRNYWDQRACTDADGVYSFAVPPGRYEVQFDPTDDAYGLQWWDGADSPVEAATLVLRRGEPQAGIDADLPAGASMTGRAIDGATGEPLVNACIAIGARGDDASVGYLQDAPDRWRIDGLPPGDLTVRVERCDKPWRFTYAYDALTVEDATVFDLQPGETTSVGEVALAAGATVKGKVTTFGSGDPLRALVALDYYPGRSGEPPLFGADSRRNGRYVIRDVQPGVHVPGAIDETYRYAVQWAGGATDIADGTSFDLAPGDVARANFRLKRSGTIIGTLAGTDVPLSVDSYSESLPDIGSAAQIGTPAYVDPETGEFVIRGLPADSFYICFVGSDFGQDDFWYDGAHALEDATLVTVRPRETVRITAHYPPPG